MSLLKSNLWIGALANFVLLCFLLLAKVLLKIPIPILAVIGIIFFGCSALWGIWTRGRTTPAKIYLIRSAAMWCIITVGFLGTIYFYDRGGWLWFKLTGYDTTLAEDLSDSLHLSSIDFIDRTPLFIIDSNDSTRLVLRKDVYEIDRTIVVPPGLTLTIEAGAELHFGVGRSLISYSPIIARGTKDEPILFTAKCKWRKWGVVAVVKADRSRFEYVTFEHGRRAVVNQINFPGSLSIIDSEVDILHSRFIYSFGKDALYVRRGKVFIRDNLFKNAYKDGLDLDGGSGIVTQNIFINCDDEGIDLSENDQVDVFDNAIYDSRGGRVAADRNLDQIKTQNKFGFPTEVILSNSHQNV
jgi:hypothetical protein